jgi:protein SCO1/2
MTFPTPALVEPLKELVFGRPTAPSALDYLGNRIRLFCTVYDPATDSYHIDISVFIGTFVGLVVSILFGRVLLREWRRSIEADR